MSHHTNHRSRTYRIARALQRCANCTALTPVVGLVLPAGHETLVAYGDTDAEHAWEISESEALLFFVESVPQEVQARLQQLSAHYRLHHEPGTTHGCWMNHCASCGVPLDDAEVFCEPEGAFAPLCAEVAASICLHFVPQPCAVQASGYVYAPELYACVRR